MGFRGLGFRGGFEFRASLGFRVPYIEVLPPRSIAEFGSQAKTLMLPTSSTLGSGILWGEGLGAMEVGMRWKKALQRDQQQLRRTGKEQAETASSALILQWLRKGRTLESLNTMS